MSARKSVAAVVVLVGLAAISRPVAAQHRSLGPYYDRSSLNSYYPRLSPVMARPSIYRDHKVERIWSVPSLATEGITPVPAVGRNVGMRRSTASQSISQGRDHRGPYRQYEFSQHRSYTLPGETIISRSSRSPQRSPRSSPTSLYSAGGFRRPNGLPASPFPR